MSEVWTAAALRAAGRAIQPPLEVTLHDGRSLVLHRIMRLLPGKRVAARAELEGETVLAKLFIARAGARRHWRRELRGIQALQARHLPTPALLVATTAGGAPVIVTRWLEEARTMSDVWHSLPESAVDEKLRRFMPVARLIGALHARGLRQQDIHPGNFLEQRGHLYIIDGDGLRVHGDRPLPSARACDNLGRFLAELSPALDDSMDALLGAYREAEDAPGFSRESLVRALAHHRRRRMCNFLAKIDRECTRFHVLRTPTRFAAVRREDAEALQPLLQDPEAFMARAELLKAGGNSTVVQTRIEGRALVIKRYNLKNLPVRLRRLRRKGRPWMAWREGMRLEFLGIATPRPIALIRDRFGPFYGRAWLVTEYLPGEDTRTRWQPWEQGPEFPEADGAKLLALLRQLEHARLTHGDMKASNILWHRDRPFLTDLDAMRMHSGEVAFQQARELDRKRLLANWSEDLPLRQWLHNELHSSGFTN